MVHRQHPEYVGAIQKRFAWAIGLALATIMMIGPLLFQIQGVLPFIICSLCIFFLWLETAFGICVGCSIYQLAIQNGVLKEPTFRPACAGGVCRIQADEI